MPNLNAAAQHPAVREIPIQRIRLVAEDIARYEHAVDKVTSHSDLEELFRPLFDGAAVEEMWVAIFDATLRPICIYKAGFGTENQCAVYPKEIMKAVLLAGGTSFSIAHNHPSGECMPSHPDKELTRAITTAARALDLRFVDHMIITTTQSFSFRREGLI